MSYRFRRIVTGHDDQGRSIVSIDDDAPNRMEIGGWRGAYLTDVWVTNEMPAENLGVEDRGARPVRHDPTPNGTIFRVVEFPPEKASKIDAAAAFASMGSKNVPSAADSARHGTMHFTDSIDYLVVLSGEMDMLLDGGEVRLRPGDCVVQRGTKHAWVVRGDVPCIAAAVLIDAKPIKRA